MGKLITVWGNPNCGKTVFAVKMAKHILENSHKSVLVFSPSLETPTLPILFPTYKKDELVSIGNALGKTDVSIQEIEKCIISIKGKQNLGFLGYCSNENKFSYPRVDRIKATSLLTLLRELADYIIIDGCSTIEDVITNVALELSDNVISLSTPTTKCMSFFSSQLPLYTDPKYKFEEHIKVMNLNENSDYVYFPINETIQHYKNIAFSLPFCSEFSLQYLNGDIIKEKTNKKYDKIIKLVLEKVK